MVTTEDTEKKGKRQRKKIILWLVLAGALLLGTSAVSLGMGEKAKEEVETSTATEIEALGPPRAVSSIMQGLGRVGETHRVLFIEVLEENYDTFLPGCLWLRRAVTPYFRFDKEKKKAVIDSRVLQWYSPKMLNAQGKMKEDIFLVVKHTLDYKGIGRRYPKYYIYEVSHVPVIINLIKPLFNEHQEYYIRFVDNLKITNLSSEGEIGFIYGEAKVRLKPEESWKDKRRSKSIFIEGDKYLKEQFDWFKKVRGMDETINGLKGRLKEEKTPFRKGISEGDLEVLKAGKVTFSTEVTIFNHGIVEIETYK